STRISPAVMVGPIDSGAIACAISMAPPTCRYANILHFIAATTKAPTLMCQHIIYACKFINYFALHKK
ncbi:hypothetical protein, partial [uncultured Agrobacterium sp.]|uniref:hypothetical protein n=1 Tax=uncultured Agrobacterium sp. TaxID=157277 RepID=UPI0025CBE983